MRSEPPPPPPPLPPPPPAQPPPHPCCGHPPRCLPRLSQPASLTAPASARSYQFIGRFQHEGAVSMFDMPGTEIRASLKLSQASPVAIKLSQRHHPHDVKGAGNTKNSGFQENAVVVWIDGVRQGPGGSNATFTTTKAQSEAPVSFPATTGNKPLAAGTHTIRIFKATEADWNGGSPAPNYLTFYGLEVQGAKPTLGPLPPLPTRKIEFLGGKCKPSPLPLPCGFLKSLEAPATA